MVGRQVELLDVGLRREVKKSSGAQAGDRQAARDDGIGVGGDEVPPAVEDLFQ